MKDNLNIDTWSWISLKISWTVNMIQWLKDEVTIKYSVMFQKIKKKATKLHCSLSHRKVVVHCLEIMVIMQNFMKIFWLEHKLKIQLFWMAPLGRSKKHSSGRRPQGWWLMVIGGQMATVIESNCRHLTIYDHEPSTLRIAWQKQLTIIKGFGKEPINPGTMWKQQVPSSRAWAGSLLIQGLE